jgi:hypothetical protein
MKYFLIGFAICFAVAWFLWFVRDWWYQWKFKQAKKHAGEDDEWIYEI